MIGHDEMPETRVGWELEIVEVLLAKQGMSLTWLSCDEVAAGRYHAGRLSGSSFVIMRNGE